MMIKFSIYIWGFLLLFVCIPLHSQETDSDFGNALIQVRDAYTSPSESVDLRIERAAEGFCRLLDSIDKTGDEGDASAMESAYQYFLDLLVKCDRMKEVDRWNRRFASRLSVKHPLRLYCMLCLTAGYKHCDDFEREQAVQAFSLKGDGKEGLQFLNDMMDGWGEMSKYDSARCEAMKADMLLFSGSIDDAADSFKKASILMKKACGEDSPEVLKIRMYEETVAAYQGKIEIAYSIATKIKEAMEKMQFQYSNLDYTLNGKDCMDYAWLLSRLCAYAERLALPAEQMLYSEEALNAIYDNVARKTYLTERHTAFSMPINGPDIYLERSLFDIKRIYAECIYKANRTEESKIVYKELLSDCRQVANSTQGVKIMSVRSLQKRIEPLISLAPQCVEKFIGDPNIEELAYDCALVYKNFSLMTENLLLEMIRHENDEVCTELYRKILYYQRERDRATESEADVLSDSIRALNERLTLRLDFSTYGAITNINWHDVQKVLTTKGAAIEFLSTKNDKGETIYYANVLRKNIGPCCVRLCTEKELTAILSPYTTIDAYKLIWQPVISLLDNVTDIYFSPTGVLHKLAIEYLPNCAKQRIKDVFNVYRLSSTRELVSSKNFKTPQNAVIYGGIDYDKAEEHTGVAYLPQTLLEMAEIKKALKHYVKVETISGQDATESNFKELSGKELNILHLSTHGFYVPKYRHSDYTKITLNPFNSLDEQSLSRSGLLMAGANRAILQKQIGEEDGILTAKEIARLDFSNVDLVTLSACETALGDVTGEGVFGLQRGFKKAGAQTIIMSLWRVDDTATRILMGNFYKTLNQGKSIHDAFTQSQEHLMTVNDGKYNDPKYWAAFIIIDAF